MEGLETPRVEFEERVVFQPVQYQPVLNSLFASNEPISLPDLSEIALDDCNYYEPLPDYGRWIREKPPSPPVEQSLKFELVEQLTELVENSSEPVEKPAEISLEPVEKPAEISLEPVEKCLELVEKSAEKTVANSLELVEKPAEKCLPVKKLAKRPVEKSLELVEKPAEKCLPVKKLAKRPVEKSLKPAEKRLPVKKLAKKRVEKSSELVEKPAEKSVEKCSDPPVKKLAKKSVEKRSELVEKPAEKSVEKCLPVKKLAKKSVEKCLDPPVKKLAKKSVEKRSELVEKPAEKSVEKPVEKPVEKRLPVKAKRSRSPEMEIPENMTRKEAREWILNFNFKRPLLPVMNRSKRAKFIEDKIQQRTEEIRNTLTAYTIPKMRDHPDKVYLHPTPEEVLEFRYRGNLKRFLKYEGADYEKKYAEGILYL